MAIAKQQTKPINEATEHDEIVANLIRITDYDDVKIAALTDSSAAYVYQIRRQLRKTVANNITSL